MKLTTTQYISIGILAVLFYLFYLGNINQYVLLVVVVIIIYTLFNTKEDGIISFREAKSIVRKEVIWEQKTGEIPRGEIELEDAGFQEYVFDNEFKPWKCYIGVKIHTFPTRYYLASVSNKGSVMSLEEREEGWKLKDEPKLIKVQSPGVTTEELPKKEEDE